ncbi:Uncharacterized protein TCM_023809 [Theobroma cacao]|uniref:Putative plant transposon protein domain-containing protein n=1 Tax=Theobroma cacao TaxID=3641 RepID=A0A061EWF4_THECC|nr:Uncharacterized protein TCM_023809 [Theobroma cacao]
MDNEYKVWYHFLKAKMLPIKHLSDVTKDRAMLLYAIILGKSIDIGQLIFNSIVHTTRSIRDGLWYPSFITGLCKQVGLQWTSNEELLHLIVPLDKGIIHRFHTHEHSTTSGSSSFAPRPPLH